jgi:hypothetical protein
MLQQLKLMNKNTPVWLYEQEITLENGDTALLSYDDEGDILEIFFVDAPATASVALNDNIILRFDRTQGRPLSLAVVGVTALTQRQEFGRPVLALEGLEKLPEADRARILHMLQASPLNMVLQLYSFKQKERGRTIPLAVLAQPLPAAA